VPGVPSEVIFQVTSPFSLIELSRAASDKLWKYRQAGDLDEEAGGVLLGTRRGPHLAIMDVTEPQPSDCRTRFGYIRRAAAHRQLARRYWLKTGRVAVYLGEWHTHPQSIPVPSAIDKSGWLALSKQIHLPLVHLILGKKEAAAWYCDQAGRLRKAVHLGSTE
jgi:integrative and conjugative element protein (TIGR02256 family)